MAAALRRRSASIGALVGVLGLLGAASADAVTATSDTIHFSGHYYEALHEYGSSTCKLKSLDDERAFACEVVGEGVYAYPSHQNIEVSSVWTSADGEGETGEFAPVLSEAWYRPPKLTYRGEGPCEERDLTGTKEFLRSPCMVWIRLTFNEVAGEETVAGVYKVSG